MEGKHGAHVIFYDLHKKAWYAGGPTSTHHLHTTYRHKLKLMTEMLAASHLLCVCAHTRMPEEEGASDVFLVALF